MTELLESEFLARARRGASPSAEDRARVLAASLKALGADALPSLSEHRGASTAEGSLSTVVARGAQGVVAKLALAALLSGVSGGVGYWLGRAHSVREAALVDGSDDPVARASAQPLPLAVPPPTSAWSERAAPAPIEAGRALQLADKPTDTHSPTKPSRSNESAAASATMARPSASASSDEELRLLRRVQRALSDSNPRLALALLSELDRRVPSSQLLQEREAAAVMARCQLGGDEGARASSLSAFERRYPDSLYNARIRQTCGAREE